VKSLIFHTDKYKEIQDKIKMFINSQDVFLSDRTASSTRAAGDAIQDMLAQNFQTLVGPDICTEYSANFARRAMADLAFEDSDGLYYVVDVKTHRLSTRFNMPNLTSVERLARFYESDRNYFVVLMIAYDIQEVEVYVKEVKFLPIEFLGWDCLRMNWRTWSGTNTDCKCQYYHR